MRLASRSNLEFPIVPFDVLRQTVPAMVKVSRSATMHTLLPVKHGKPLDPGAQETTEPSIHEIFVCAEDRFFTLVG